MIRDEHNIIYNNDNEEYIENTYRDETNESRNMIPVVRYKKKESKVYQRYIKLMKALVDARLEYRKNGICDKYIKFGFPSIEEVINELQKRTNNEERRLKRLIKKLKKKNLQYDRNVNVYQEYIKRGGNIKETINEGETEWFLINKTKYLEFREKYLNEDRAKSAAISQYIRNHGVDEYIESIKKKELTISIY